MQPNPNSHEQHLKALYTQSLQWGLPKIFPFSPSLSQAELPNILDMAFIAKPRIDRHLKYLSIAEELTTASAHQLDHYRTCKRVTMLQSEQECRILPFKNIWREGLCTDVRHRIFLNSKVVLFQPLCCCCWSSLIAVIAHLFKKKKKKHFYLQRT